MMPDDLFSFAEKYPQVPGSKTGGASAEAAVKMRTRAETLDADLLRYLANNPPICADDYAALKGIDVLSARPMFSRCKKRGHVEKLPERGKSKSENSCHLYTITQAGRRIA